MFAIKRNIGASKARKLALSLSIVLTLLGLGVAGPDTGKPLAWFVAQDFIFEVEDSEPSGQKYFRIQAPETLVLEGEQFKFEGLVLEDAAMEISVASEQGFGHKISSFRLAKELAVKAKLEAIFSPTAPSSKKKAVVVSLPLKIIPQGVTERSLDEVEKDFEKKK